MGEQKAEDNEKKGAEEVTDLSSPGIMDKLANSRLLRIGGYIGAIIFFLYMLVAVLSFVKVIPTEIALKFPIISSVIKRIAEMDSMGAPAPVTPYQLHTKTVYPKFSRVYKKKDPDTIIRKPLEVQAKKESQIVMKRKFYDGKNVGEIYIDDYLVMRIYNKAEYLNAYQRADAITKRIKAIIDQKADMSQLEPKPVDGKVGIYHGDQNIAKVSHQDAVLNNSTPLQQAISWINNIRISMGVLKMLKPENLHDVKEQLKKEEAKKVEDQKQQAQQRKKEEDEARKKAEEETRQEELVKIREANAIRKKKIKKLVKVYEAMPSGEAIDIFNKMSDDQVAEILSLMGDRKLSKILAVMEPRRAARITRKLTK